jgi:hypothetical protein
MLNGLSLQFNRERLVAILTQIIGLLALALPSVGLCGVVKLSVARRTAEIGLRIALGVANTESRRIVGGDCSAPGRDCHWHPFTLASARLIWHQLFGVGNYDPASLAGAAALLAGCTIAAALIRARRAALIGPMLALGVE